MAYNTFALPSLGTPGYNLSAGASSPYYAGIQNTMYVNDEFLYGAYNGATTGIWSQNNNIAGSGIQNINGIALHPGIVQLTAGPLGFASLQTYRYAVLFGSGPIYLDALVLIPTLSTGVNRFDVVIGFSDAFNVDGAANGAYFTYSDNINSGKWQAVTYNGSATSVADTTVTVANNTWYHLNIVINSAASSIVFSVNGANPTTITTNIPTTNACRVNLGVNNTVGAGLTSQMNVDCFSMLQIFSSNRFS